MNRFDYFKSRAYFYYIPHPPLFLLETLVSSCLSVGHKNYTHNSFEMGIPKKNCMNANYHMEICILLRQFDRTIFKGVITLFDLEYYITKFKHATPDTI